MKSKSTEQSVNICINPFIILHRSGKCTIQTYKYKNFSERVIIFHEFSLIIKKHALNLVCTFLYRF